MPVALGSPVVPPGPRELLVPEIPEVPEVPVEMGNGADEVSCIEERTESAYVVSTDGVNRVQENVVWVLTDGGEGLLRYVGISQLLIVRRDDPIKEKWYVLTVPVGASCAEPGVVDVGGYCARQLCWVWVVRPVHDLLIRVAVEQVDVDLLILSVLR